MVDFSKSSLSSEGIPVESAVGGRQNGDGEVV